MGFGIGGVVDKVKSTVQNVAKTVERAAEKVSKRVNELTHPAVRAHQGEDGFDHPGPVAQSRDRPGGPTVYKPGDGPHFA